MMSATGTLASACADSADSPMNTLAPTASRPADAQLERLRELGQRACVMLAESAGLRSCVMLVWVGQARPPTPVGQYGRSGAQLASVAAALPEVRDRALTGAVPTELPGAGLILIPLADRGPAIGVVVGRRRRDAPSLRAQDRRSLAHQSRALAVAVVSQLAALRAQRLDHDRERAALARTLHETVVQRLCAASMVMSAGELDFGARECCAQEMRLALAELRATLVASAESQPGQAGGLAADLTALRAAPGVTVRMRGAAPRLAPNQEAATRAALAEAVRNARKHGGDDPIRVAVDVDVAAERVTLDVVNTIRTEPNDHVTGIGLRLAAAEARHSDVLLRHGAESPRRWRMHVVAPTTPEAP
jgi:signal transduction histidine kinase